MPNQRNIALIFGAASETGRRHAQQLVDAGATVIVSDVKSPALCETWASLGQGVQVIPADLSHEEALHNVFDRVVTQHGPIHSLVLPEMDGEHSPSLLERLLNFARFTLDEHGSIVSPTATAAAA